MQTEFVRDLVDEKEAIEAALRERPGKPLRLRFQPTILRQKAGQKSQYRNWTDVCWGLECASATEAYAIRDVLRTLFETLNTASPEQVIVALRALGSKGEAA